MKGQHWKILWRNVEFGHTSCS